MMKEVYLSFVVLILNYMFLLKNSIIVKNLIFSITIMILNYDNGMDIITEIQNCNKKNILFYFLTQKNVHNQKFTQFSVDVRKPACVFVYV